MHVRTCVTFVIAHAYDTSSNPPHPASSPTVPKATVEGANSADVAPPNVQISATNNDELSFYNVSVSNCCPSGTQMVSSKWRSQLTAVVHGCILHLLMVCVARRRLHQHIAWSSLQLTPCISVSQYLNHAHHS